MVYTSKNEGGQHNIVATPLYNISIMHGMISPSYTVLRTFCKTLDPIHPVLIHDCDLLMHLHNPGVTHADIAIVVGTDVVQRHALAPGETCEVIDNGPLPMVALEYRVVKIVCNTELQLTCGICSNEDRRKLVACRIGRWLYSGSTMTRGR